MKTPRFSLVLVAGVLGAMPLAHAQEAAPGLPAPDSPVAAALHAELVVDRDAAAPVRQFYAARGFAPLWLDADGGASDAARSLLDWVGEAERHALPAARYDTAELGLRLAREPSEAAGAELELELTRLFLDYARDLSSGLLEPGEISRQIHIEPPRPEPATLLSRAAKAGDMEGFLAGLAPSDPTYDQLLTLYRDIQAIARTGGWGRPIEQGPTLRRGDRDPRMPRIRDRLMALGDLPPVEQVASSEVMTDAEPQSSESLTMGGRLESAVLRFQERHGLNTDGAIGPKTLAALNTSASERAAQVAVNLERMRWLNRDPGRRHVVINIPAYRMTLIEDGKPRFSTRTIVGKANRHETPEFTDTLEHLVINPYWNVPRSITVEEILPELRKDPTYLERNNMELVGFDVPSSEINWEFVSPSIFPARVRQRPGPGNALGAVKFLFPNQYSIYMHDTPTKRLFERDERDFSHGCVRLQDPFEFAHLLLGMQSDNPEGLFARLRSREGQQWVTLENPIPVYLTYRTAWVDEADTWQFRADIYGRDASAAAALEAKGVALPKG